MMTSVDLLVTMIAVSVTAAMIQYVHERILAPSLRLRLRFRMFALRDDLRREKISGGESIPDRTFKFLDESLSNGIMMIPRINLWLVLFGMRSINAERQEIVSRVEARRNELRAHSNPELQRIFRESRIVLHKAILINSLFFILGTLPFLVLGIVVRGLIAKIKRQTKESAREILLMSPADAEQLFADEGYAV